MHVSSPGLSYNPSDSSRLLSANMRVLVGVKRVIDYAVKVRIAADKKGEFLLPPFNKIPSWRCFLPDVEYR